MKLKKIISIGVIAGCLGLTVLSCGPSPSKIKKNYVKTEEVNVDKKESSLELGQKVNEEFSILYSETKPISWNKAAEASYGKYGGPHGIEYVKVSNINGEKWLVYPYIMGIDRKPADITYWPIKPGEMSADKFVKIFVDKDATAKPDNFPLNGVDGIIVPDSTGIVYK